MTKGKPVNKKKVKIKQGFKPEKQGSKAIKFTVKKAELTSVNSS